MRNMKLIFPLFICLSLSLGAKAYADEESVGTTHGTSASDPAYQNPASAKSISDLIFQCKRSTDNVQNKGACFLSQLNCGGGMKECFQKVCTYLDEYNDYDCTTDALLFCQNHYFKGDGQSFKSVESSDYVSNNINYSDQLDKACQPKKDDKAKNDLFIPSVHLIDISEMGKTPTINTPSTPNPVVTGDQIGNTKITPQTSNASPTQIYYMSDCSLNPLSSGSIGISWMFLLPWLGIIKKRFKKA